MTIWRNLWCLHAGKKLILSFTFSLRYCKLVILGTSGMPGYAHPNWYWHLVENFRVYLQPKNQLHPPHFPWDIAMINLLFWVIRACLATHSQWYYQLAENFMFICVSKINFIVYFFLGILHFKESCNLIGQHSILAYKSRTRIFPDMGLMVKYQ